jgi:hypothetical protein
MEVERIPPSTLMRILLNNSLYAAWIPILFLAASSTRANAATENHFVAFAQSCDVAASVGSARVFSDNGKHGWKEYPSPKQIPENTEWSEAAYVWGKVDSALAIDVEGLGEDFGDSAYYCFNAPGKLSSIEYEFRTAWGWGFTERREIDSGGRETVRSHFFGMQDRKEIPRPETADDVREAMTVKIYRRLSDVPFSNLFMRGTKSK